MLIKIGKFQGNLVFDYNAMCLIEESMNLSVIELIGSPEKIGVRAIRSFLYAGLHKEHGIQEEQIGDMLEKVVVNQGKTGLDKISRLVVEAMKKSEILSDEKQPPQPGKYEKKSHSHK